MTKLIHTLFALALMPVSGCCGLCGGNDGPDKSDPGTTDPGADPGAAVTPLPLSECKAINTSIGAWRPSTKVLGRVARAIPNDTCISNKQIAATLASCASQANSATVEASVEAPGFSACSHTSRAMTWNNRHWVSISAFVGEGANFHGQSYIYEIEGEDPVAAYTGFAAASELCGSEVGNPENKTSPKLKADWASMPENVRKFFCE